MALFTKSPKVNPAYAPSTEVLDAADALSEALDGRVRIDSAISRNTDARTAAGEARQAADTEVQRIEVELALEVDEMKINALESAVTSARAASTNATAVVERAVRLQGALHTRAIEADAAIAIARQAFQTAVGAFGREISEALAIEAREAAQHLVKVLMRGHAIASSLGTLSQGVGFIGETTVPSPAPLQRSIIGAGRADLADGTRIDLAAEWRTDPTAAAVADLLQPIADLRRLAAMHSTFVPPPPAAKPYEPQNRWTAEEIAAERAADAAWSPPKSTFTGQVHRLEHHPQRVDLNVVGGVTDRAVDELGGAA
jgi:hypothetical protein